MQPEQRMLYIMPRNFNGITYRLPNSNSLVGFQRNLEYSHSVRHVYHRQYENLNHGFIRNLHFYRYTYTTCNVNPMISRLNPMANEFNPNDAICSPPVNFHQSNLNPNASAFCPSPTLRSGLNPSANEFYPSRSELNQIHNNSNLNPNASIFHPLYTSQNQINQINYCYSNLNPDASSFHPFDTSQNQQNQINHCYSNLNPNASSFYPNDTNQNQVNHMQNNHSSLNPNAITFYPSNAELNQPNQIQNNQSNLNPNASIFNPLTSSLEAKASTSQPNSNINICNQVEILSNLNPCIATFYPVDKWAVKRHECCIKSNNIEREAVKFPSIDSLISNHNENFHYTENLTNGHHTCTNYAENLLNDHHTYRNQAENLLNGFHCNTNDENDILLDSFRDEHLMFDQDFEDCFKDPMPNDQKVLFFGKQMEFNSDIDYDNFTLPTQFEILFLEYMKKFEKECSKGL